MGIEQELEKRFMQYIITRVARIVKSDEATRAEKAEAAIGLVAIALESNASLEGRDSRRILTNILREYTEAAGILDEGRFEALIVWAEQGCPPRHNARVAQEILREIERERGQGG
jgi:hypothetical protein